MKKDPRFDDIRPYYEEEIPDAMRRIASNPAFPILASFVFPDEDIEQVRTMVKNLSTTKEFQTSVMYEANRQIMRQSTSSFTCEGIEKLRKDKSYLFVSNHRDIMLDASFLQNVLIDNGFETSEITFGANLMNGQLIIDIGKSNKMFRVERGGNARDFYLSSAHLSEYIRDAIVGNGHSVWIAQRNGRTKDGNDATDQGIIKMFSMSKSDDKIGALDELNIVPVSVSYEWEPCDIQKVLELYETSQRAYAKKPGEDLSSILSGIMAFKGHVHFHICDPMTEEELLAFNEYTSSRYNREVASLIDRKICSNYKLYPNNWIAHDIRYGQNRHTDKYTPEQKAAFIERMGKLEKYENYDLETLRDIFLGIYANPVDNYLRFQE